jgi:hypothetical protein
MSRPLPHRIAAVLHASAWLALLALLCTLTLRAAEGTPNFEEANRLFEQERYEDAAKAYRALLNSGQFSPAVHFNLGNALFKSGKVGEAIVEYRRASALAPRDPDILANLQFARSSIAGGGTGSRERWRRLLGRLSLDEWSIAASACLWVWMGLLAVGVIRPGWRKSARPLCIAAGLATCAVSAGLARVAWDHYRAEPVVVIVPEAPVRYGPLPESQIFFSARNGLEFIATDRKGDWVRVEDNLNRAGWVRIEQLAWVRASRLRSPQNHNGVASK